MANLKAEVYERCGVLSMTVSRMATNIENIRGIDTPSFMLEDCANIERLLTAARYQNAAVRRAVKALSLQRAKGGA